MDPARLSMTPSTDSSVKKVTCGREERGCQPSVEPGGHGEPLGPSTLPSPACPPCTTYHQREWPLPGDDANKPRQRQLRMHKPRGEDEDEDGSLPGGGA